MFFQRSQFWTPREPGGLADPDPRLSDAESELIIGGIDCTTNLALKFDDASDSSFIKHSVTSSGVSFNSEVSKFSERGALFGLGNYLSVAANMAFDLTLISSHSIDFWFCIDRFAGSGSEAPLIGRSVNASNNWSVYISDGNALTFRIINQGVPQGICTTSVFRGVWYHAALVWDQGVVSLWLNGVNTFGELSVSGVFEGQSDCPVIVGGGSFSGFMDELRWSRGVKYLENFTPPVREYEPLYTFGDTVSVTAQVEGSGSIGGFTGPYNAGDSATVTALADTDWNFLFWRTSGGVIVKNRYSASSPAYFMADGTLTAVFSESTARITLKCSAGGTTNPPPGDYAVSEAAKFLFTIIPDSGYGIDRITYSGPVYHVCSGAGTVGDPESYAAMTNWAAAMGRGGEIFIEFYKHVSYVTLRVDSYLLYGGGMDIQIPKNTHYMLEPVEITQGGNVKYSGHTLTNNLILQQSAEVRESSGENLYYGCEDILAQNSGTALIRYFIEKDQAEGFLKTDGFTSLTPEVRWLYKLMVTVADAEAALAGTGSLPITVVKKTAVSPLTGYFYKISLDMTNNPYAEFLGGWSPVAGMRRNGLRGEVRFTGAEIVLHSADGTTGWFYLRQRKACLTVSDAPGDGALMSPPESGTYWFWENLSEVSLSVTDGVDWLFQNWVLEGGAELCDPGADSTSFTETCVKLRGGNGRVYLNGREDFARNYPFVTTLEKTDSRYVSVWSYATLASNFSGGKVVVLGPKINRSLSLHMAVTLCVIPRKKLNAFLIMPHPSAWGSPDPGFVTSSEGAQTEYTYSVPNLITLWFVKDGAITDAQSVANDVYGGILDGGWTCFRGSRLDTSGVTGAAVDLTLECLRYDTQDKMSGLYIGYPSFAARYPDVDDALLDHSPTERRRAVNGEISVTAAVQSLGSSYLTGTLWPAVGVTEAKRQALFYWNYSDGSQCSSDLVTLCCAQFERPPLYALEAGKGVYSSVYGNPVLWDDSVSPVSNLAVRLGAAALFLGSEANLEMIRQTVVVKNPGIGTDFTNSQYTKAGVWLPRADTADTTPAIVIGPGSSSITFKAVASGPGNVTPSLASQTSAGVAVSVTATPAPGYFFIRWELASGSGSIADIYAASTTVTPSTHTIARAVFSDKCLLRIRTHNGLTFTAGGVTIGEENLVAYNTVFELDRFNLPYLPLVFETGNARELDSGSSGKFRILVQGYDVLWIDSDTSGGCVLRITHEGQGSLLSAHSVEAGTGDWLLTLPANRPVELKAAADEGWDFVSWSAGSYSVFTVTGALSADPTRSVTAITVSAPVTTPTTFAIASVLFAVQNDSAVLRMQASAGGSVTPAAGDHTVTREAQVSVTAAPASGYTFGGWAVSETAAIDDASALSAVAVVTGILGVLKALFNARPSTYPVSVTVENSDSSGITVYSGSFAGVIINPPVTLNLGWGASQFIGCICDIYHRVVSFEVSGGIEVISQTLGGTNPNVVFNVTGPGSIQIIAENTGTTNRGLFVVKAEPSDRNTVTPATALVAVNTARAILASPVFGCAFAGWTVTSGEAELDDSSQASTTATVTGESNATITASFTYAEYALTLALSHAHGGFISGGQSVYTAGRFYTFTLTQSASSGLLFSAWAVTGGAVLHASGVSSIGLRYATVYLEGAGTLTAVFVEDYVALSVSGDEHTQTVSPETASVIKYGTCQISCSPKPGNLFQRWEIVSGSAEIADARASSTSARLLSDAALRAVCGVTDTDTYWATLTFVSAGHPTVADGSTLFTVSVPKNVQTRVELPLDWVRANFGDTGGPACFLYYEAPSEITMTTSNSSTTVLLSASASCVITARMTPMVSYIPGTLAAPLRLRFEEWSVSGARSSFITVTDGTPASGVTPVTVTAAAPEGYVFAFWQSGFSPLAAASVQGSRVGEMFNESSSILRAAYRRVFKKLTVSSDSASADGLTPAPGSWYVRQVADDSSQKSTALVASSKPFTFNSWSWGSGLRQRAAGGAVLTSPSYAANPLYFDLVSDTTLKSNGVDVSAAQYSFQQASVFGVNTGRVISMPVSMTGGVTREYPAKQAVVICYAVIPTARLRGKTIQLGFRSLSVQNYILASSVGTPSGTTAREVLISQSSVYDSVLSGKGYHSGFYWDTGYSTTAGGLVLIDGTVLDTGALAAALMGSSAGMTVSRLELRTRRLAQVGTQGSSRNLFKTNTAYLFDGSGNKTGLDGTVTAQAVDSFQDTYTTLCLGYWQGRNLADSGFVPSPGDLTPVEYEYLLYNDGVYNSSVKDSGSAEFGLVITDPAGAVTVTNDISTLGVSGKSSYIRFAS